MLHTASPPGKIAGLRCLALTPAPEARTEQLGQLVALASDFRMHSQEQVLPDLSHRLGTALFLTISLLAEQGREIERLRALLTPPPSPARWESVSGERHREARGRVRLPGSGLCGVSSTDL